MVIKINNRSDQLNVLLTGGTGYIGSHAAVVLAQAGYGVTLYDNFSNSQPLVLVRLKQILGQSLTCVTGDVRDTELLQQTLVEAKIDAVLHFAGLKAVGESVQDPISYYANNVQGAISLVQAMQSVGVKTLVFSSSATVYGDPLYLPLDEQHPLKATNPYGRTKLMIEEILSDLAQSDSSWKIACLRYFNPVGAHESGLIGEEPNEIPNNLMPYVLRVASGELQELSVFGGDYETPDGTGVRDYIHVMDLVRGHVAALRYAEQTNGRHVFNLGTGKGSSVLEMIQTFENCSGKHVNYRIVGRRPGDIATCYASTDKASKILGWEAELGVAEMCDSMWRRELKR
jgi:UDP-glucose 4-epimerase